jgi:GMP synthase-like glutamine amidotransferase
LKGGRPDDAAEAKGAGIITGGAMTNKFLVVQHVPHEGLGVIGQAMARAGVQAEFLKVYAGRSIPRSAAPYPGIIVLGGPMGVYEDDRYPFIKDEIRLIESALKEDVPFLGICLGSQMLAKAAGARVYRGGAKEIGFYGVRLTADGASDGLFMGQPDEFTVFQWHGDTFDLPRGARNLASSDLFPHQLIRVGGRAYGAQFHLEVTPAMIKEWIAVNRDELKALRGVIDPDEILMSIPAHMEALHGRCAVVIARFLRLSGL